MEKRKKRRNCKRSYSYSNCQFLTVASCPKGNLRGEEGFRLRHRTEGQDHRNWIRHPGRCVAQALFRAEAESRQGLLRRCAEPDGHGALPQERKKVSLILNFEFCLGFCEIFTRFLHFSCCSLVCPFVCCVWCLVLRVPESCDTRNINIFC